MYSSLNFRKSSYSANDSACVEVADAPGVSAVRDTQNRDQVTLAFPSKEWRAMVTSARRGV
ncbi:DUF397 domain-containing protein [Nocardiopsis sp. LOL_012]|uniref:DUF397 domain-containing protein n=1 Tax=Nocardiopsis sp. LOL_012 TaxID=3345409 RepID=UPI003A87055A